jgi:UDP-N-acetylmuramoyl-L-alanyl-D-glutamate--2,6-diaminopimelate ligase
MTNGNGNGKKKLLDLTKGVPCTVHGNTALEVKSLAYHSARVEPGALFVAIDGFRTSGADYIDEAVNRGAVAVATSDMSRVRKNWVTLIHTKSPRRFLAQAANRFYDFPSRKVGLIGVTGTNGKTTTSYLLRAMARQAGIEPGFVGTIEYWDGVEKRPAGQTTPESLDFVRLLARAAERSIPFCIAEVSSHSLALDRVSDLDFRIAVFTNLTQDHLDFHRTIEAYREAKMKLFTDLVPGSVAVTNLDDAMGRDVPHRTRARVITYGTRPDLEPVPDISGRVLGVRPDGIDCELVIAERLANVRLRLGGRYNLSNLMAAAGAGLGLGWPLEQIVAGAESLESVPGRLEPVNAGQDFGVFVDYAHTPDALRRVLGTVREFTTGRVILVFGCGGDRDRGKRPMMGEAAAQLADVRIVTSDNPRSEQPQAIADEILRGMGTQERAVELDREAAIDQALDLARAGDSVVIAGKGHEDYQIVGSERRHFDDREVCRRILNR